MIFPALSLFLLLLFILLIPIFFFLVQIQVVRIALGKLGLSPGIAILILILSLIGSHVNIPLFSREVTGAVPQHDLSSFFLPSLPSPDHRQIIGINVGGAVIPLLLCLIVLPKTPFLPAFFATLVSTMVCFRLSHVVPGVGVTIPAYIPPLAAVVLAFLFSPKNKIPVAYVAGVLGVLIGADLLNLPNLGNSPGMMSIGGAGVYDGIFLVGIIAALLA